MQYAAAAKCTKNSPCTNVPIHCPICPKTLSGEYRTIWKYNTMFHFAEEHSTINDDGETPQVTAELLVDSFVSLAEGKALGVDEDVTRAYRQKNDIPDSDEIEVMRSELKRDRAASSVSVGARKRRGGVRGAN